MKNKILTILLAFVIAFGLWAYVITVEKPESAKTYYDIPVVLQNESILTERGLMIVSERPTVTLDLVGTRANLNDLNESNINVICNVASIVTPGTHQLTYNVAYPGNIPSGSVTRQKSVPDMVTLKVENRITKQIQVVPDYMGTTVPEGMIADKENLVLDHPTIEISGPQSVMDQITQAVIQVDLSGQTETVVGEYSYTLCNDAFEPVDAQLVTTNVELVNLKLPIRWVKEITLELNVIEGGGATKLTSVIDIQPKTIRVSGSASLLDDLDVLQIGTIDLGTLEAGLALNFDIILPEGLTNETGISQAKVDVKFPNLMVKTFQVDNIVLENIPQGMEAELITQLLEVKLRGPAGLMENITAADIKAVVDLSQAAAGTDKFAVQIVLDSEFAGLGALNSYTVMVALTQTAA